MKPMGAAIDGQTTQSDKVAYPAWFTTKLISFRFAFSYLFLYCLDVLSFDLARIVNSSRSRTEPPIFMQVLWARIVPWVGQHILHLHAFPPIYVGGDFVYEYVLRGVELVVAILAAIIWTGLDRHRRDYRLLHAWLRVFARPMLGTVMIFYGMVKVFPVQFGSLTLHRLSTPVGELGPMAMLWIFMAASPVYTILSGLVETVGGLLLLFPRTTALGALISAGAMANVLVLNILYDVNQKIRCVHYLLLALFLLAPQVPRLWNVLVMNRRTEPLPEPSLSPRGWVRSAALLVPLVFGLLIFTITGFRAAMRYKAQKATEATRGPYYGVWRAKTFVVSDESRLLFTDKLNADMNLTPGRDRWKQLTFDLGNVAVIKLSGIGDDFVDAKTDGATGAVTLSDTGDPAWQCALHFVRPTPDSLEMKGTVNGNNVTATFERIDGSSYHLADPVRWMSDGQRGY